MKTLFCTVLLSVTFVFSAAAQATGGWVAFNNRVTGVLVAPIYDTDGATKLVGTNFWARLYATPGLTATESELAPAGIPVNFRTSVTLAGTVQVSGVNALGQAVEDFVQVTPVLNGPASVQMRVWAGPATSYEAAVAGGARAGVSRVFRLTSTVDAYAPEGTYLIDADGPLQSFSLTGLPYMAINDLKLSEGSSGGLNALVLVTISPTSTQTVTVAYTTVDGTATAGSDYVATNGVLTFTPGQTNKYVSVALTPDAGAEGSESFTVALSSAANAHIGRAVGTVTILPDVAITGLSVDVAVTFTTLSGRRYAVEKATDPSTGPLNLVVGATNILGTGNQVTALDKGAGCSPGAFSYRVRVIQ